MLAPIYEQAVYPMVHAWLSSEFEMLVFGDKRGLPLILFPTSGARYFENKDFRLIGALAWHIDNGKVTV